MEFCWYQTYPISYRQLKKMMCKRWAEVDYFMLNRWIMRYVPLLKKKFVSRERHVGVNWRPNGT